MLSFWVIFLSCHHSDPHVVASMTLVRISPHHFFIVNSVCCGHSLVSGPTSKRPVSDGGLGSGLLLMM